MTNSLIYKLKINLSIDNLVKIFSILFILLLEFRVFQLKSFSLADPIFILLTISILIREKVNVLGLFKYDDKLVKIFSIFSIIWVASYLSPVLTYDDSIAFFKSNSVMIIGSIYLVAITISFLYLTIELGWLFIAKAILYSGLINALLGITGLLLFMAGIDSGLVTLTGTSSPYLNGFPRLLGFSLTPNALAYSLFISSLMLIPLFYSNAISKRFFLVSSIIIFIALMLTFSKTLLIFILTYTSWYLNSLFRSLKLEKARKYLLPIVLFSGLFMYVLVTHIMIVSKDETDRRFLLKGDCIHGDEIVFSSFDEVNVQFCPTLLLKLKILYFQSGVEKLPWGSGATNDLIEDINFGHTPHTTYLERFALHGVIGILSMFVLIYMISKALYKIRESNLSFDNLYYVFYLFWLMHAYMSINEDMLRYRILWVFIGITLGIAVAYAKKNP